MRTPTSIAAAIGLSVMMLSGTVSTGVAEASSTSGGGRVSICHRTHSVTNPYRLITVSQSAVTSGSTQRNHTHHTGPVFDPDRVYEPDAKVWGDIIPTGKETLASLIPAGVLCGAMTAGEFYNVEREAGVSRAEILLDLAEQGAEEDTGVQFAAVVYTGTDATVMAQDTGTTVGPVDEPASEPVDPATSEPVEPPTSEPVEPPTSEPVEPPTSEPVEPPTSEPTSPEPTSPEPTSPEPTSSEPTTAAPPATPAPPATTQVIDGTVWLDQDRDGRRNGREVGIPGAVVDLYRVGDTGIASAVLGGAGLGGRVSSVRLDVTEARRVATTRTDTTGAFAFTGLAAGAYRVVAHHAEDLDVTWDGDDERDAVADMDLPEGGHGSAAVGLVGSAGIEVDLLTSDGRPVADGDVVVRSAGKDSGFDTADDLVLTAPVVDGRVEVDGLPGGAYRIELPDGSGASLPVLLSPGETMSAELLLPGALPAPTVAVAGPVAATTPPAPRPVFAPAAPAPVATEAAAPAADTTAAPAPAVAAGTPQASHLAATGADPGDLVVLAAMLVLGGMLLLGGPRLLVRRPRGRHVRV